MDSTSTMFLPTSPVTQAIHNPNTGNTVLARSMNCTPSVPPDESTDAGYPQPQQTVLARSMDCTSSVPPDESSDAGQQTVSMHCTSPVPDD